MKALLTVKNNLMVYFHQLNLTFSLGNSTFSRHLHLTEKLKLLSELSIVIKFILIIKLT